LKLLLDTHALLWWLSDDDRIGPRARGMIADPANDICVSVVSLWDIVVKLKVGTLAAEIGDILAAIERDRVGWLAITVSYLLILSGLPTHHRDPFRSPVDRAGDWRERDFPLRR
jgi:PIN domain nuclease of toxin-antitoxin system